MANNIDVKFSGLVELRAAGYKHLGTNGDDCLRAVHTNFYNSTYSYNAAEFSASGIINPELAFNRNDTDYAQISNGTRSFVFNNYRIRPHAIAARLASFTTLSNSGYVIRVRGFNETNIEFTEVIQPSFILDVPTNYLWVNLNETNPNIRRGWVDQIEFQSGTAGWRIYQLYIYGEIIHEQQTKLPPSTGATTIESFSDSFIDVDSKSEGTIVKEGSIRLEQRRAHNIFRVTLSSTYDIPDDAQYNVWNFDPNGANRIVNLPRYPQFNHYLRINNLDGSFQIRINDSDHSTLIQNLSNADGPNTLEAVWANNQWIITT